MIRRIWRDMVDSTEWVETRKTLRGMRSHTLGSLPEGKFGRVVGKCVALNGAYITAPFTNRRCLAYALSAEARTSMLFVERESVPFEIEVAGQRAIVDPRGARVSLSRTLVAKRAAFDRPTPRQRVLLDQIVGEGIVPDAIAFDEAVISEGDELVIAGFGVREEARRDASTDSDRGADPYRGVATRLRLVGTKGHPLLIANDRRLV